MKNTIVGKMYRASAWVLSSLEALSESAVLNLTMGVKLYTSDFTASPVAEAQIWSELSLMEPHVNRHGLF